MLPEEDTLGAVAERWRRLRLAGYNVLNLRPNSIDAPLDLVSDVPNVDTIGALGAETGECFDPFEEPPLQELAASLYGRNRIYIPTLKGKGAERALTAALRLRFGTKGFSVVTHGLFRTTERHLRAGGAEVESGPLDPGADNCSLDLEWLQRRMAARRCDVVFLEVCNNGIGGWLLPKSHVERVRALCDAHGSMLAIDATRLLSNASMDQGDVLEDARALSAMADVVSLSCAKECFVAAGGLVGLPSYDLAKAAYTAAWGDGGSLEPLSARIALARGIRYAIANAAHFRARRDQLESLRARLVLRGVPCVAPVGGHAVYVIVDELLDRADPTRAYALEALLYAACGVRAKIHESVPLAKTLLRLCIPIHEYRTSALDQVAAAVAELFRGAQAAPSLEPELPPTFLHPRLERFRTTQTQ
jgi:tryptophanase